MQINLKVLCNVFFFLDFRLLLCLSPWNLHIKRHCSFLWKWAHYTFSRGSIIISLTLILEAMKVSKSQERPSNVHCVMPWTYIIFVQHEKQFRPTFKLSWFHLLSSTYSLHLNLLKVWFHYCSWNGKVSHQCTHYITLYLYQSPDTHREELSGINHS